MTIDFYENANILKEIVTAYLEDEKEQVDKKKLDEAVEYCFTDCIDYMALVATMEYFLLKHDMKKCVKYDKKIKKTSFELDYIK